MFVEGQQRFIIKLYSHPASLPLDCNSHFQIISLLSGEKIFYLIGRRGPSRQRRDREVAKPILFPQFWALVRTKDRIQQYSLES